MSEDLELTDIGHDVVQSVVNSRHGHHPRGLILPNEILAGIDEGLILVTITGAGWAGCGCASYIRREAPNEYAVRLCDEEGELSGVHHVTRHEARQLIDEKCCEAVWGALRPRSAWPIAECTEVDSG